MLQILAHLLRKLSAVIVSAIMSVISVFSSKPPTMPTKEDLERWKEFFPVFEIKYSRRKGQLTIRFKPDTSKEKILELTAYRYAIAKKRGGMTEYIPLYFLEPCIKEGNVVKTEPGKLFLPEDDNHIVFVIDEGKMRWEDVRIAA